MCEICERLAPWGWQVEGCSERYRADDQRDIDDELRDNDGAGLRPESRADRSVPRCP